VTPNANKEERPCTLATQKGQAGQAESCGADNFRLHRWLVSFGSGQEWYPVGEFVALDAAAAIDRAIEVFGSGSSHRAEEIPWDAAPLPKPRLPSPRRGR
jgi:hypothetical protein